MIDSDREYCAEGRKGESSIDTGDDDVGGAYVCIPTGVALALLAGGLLVVVAVSCRNSRTLGAFPGRPGLS